MFLPQLGFCVILIGLILHLGAKLNLRRSFGIVPADRGVKTLGLYAFVRHPMYLGYMVAHVGFLLGGAIAVERFGLCGHLGAADRADFFEERFLSLNPDYRAYCAESALPADPGPVLNVP